MNNDNKLHIIDAHAHLGYIGRCYIPDLSTDDMISLMDRLHIKHACFSHVAALLSHQFEYAHIETLKAVKKYRGRVYGYAVYDPIFPEDSLKSINEFISEDGFIGIKIHPGCHVYPIDGDAYNPLWEFAGNKNIPVLCHTWDGTPQTTYPYEIVPPQVNAEPGLFNNVLKKHPDLTIILGHSGGHFRGHLQAIEVAKKYANVFLDISGAPIGFGLIEWFVREVGAEKILYGSDFILIDPRVHIGRVLRARIGTEQKEAILSKNAESLFNF
jgi:predicted TIM-barrel fold metal-dependent hydrolase